MFFGYMTIVRGFQLRRQRKRTPAWTDAEQVSVQVIRLPRVLLTTRTGCETLTETNLAALYGVPLKRLSFEHDGQPVETFAPVLLPFRPSR